MAKLLRGAAERGHLVVGLGDFNMLPCGLAHRLITSHAPVRDVWRVLHPDSSLGPSDDLAERARRRPIPTADFNVSENGVTSDSVFNTWRWTPAQQRLLGEGKDPCVVPNDAIDRHGKRLDYIFAGTGDIVAAGGAGWVVRSVKVGMMERHERLGCSLSDHFSVEASLVFHTPSAARESEDTAVSNGTYLQTQSPATSDPVDPFDRQLKAALRGSDEDCLPAVTYDEILSMIHKYTLRERTQRFWRGAHFFAALTVLAACLAGVWFVPRNFVAFILLLVGSLSLTAGTVDGLISLLFMGSEIRALKEFEWEIMNAKSGGDLVDSVRTEPKGDGLGP
jgi:sphingomyelin phosphodiesterase 2